MNKTHRTIQTYLQKLKEKNYIDVKVLNNNYRLITTIDTRVGIDKHKKPVKNELKYVNKQIGIGEPDWMKEYVEELKRMES
jgi:hypothetical protein